MKEAPGIFIPAGSKSPTRQSALATARRARTRPGATRQKLRTSSCCCEFTEYGSVTKKAEGVMAQVSGEQVQVQIKADEKELLGQFSNLVMFHHNAEEFTLHFIYVFPNVPQGKLLSSVIVSPAHAKRILRALNENISRYEAQFGPIKEAPETTPIPNVGFVQ
jgi:hypothetical protein